MGWTREAVAAEIKSVIEEHADEPVELSDSTELVADLGIDSLGVMEVVADIEDKFDITIADADLREVATFGEVVAAIETKLRRQGSLDEPTVAAGEAGEQRSATE